MSKSCGHERGIYTLSVLLKLALLTSSLSLPSNAARRTSEPMCSPSRSQSVQIKSARESRACCFMLFAIALLSFIPVSFARSRFYQAYLSNRLNDWHVEQPVRTARPPFSVLLREIHACKMPEDTCHIDRTISPWLTKIEVKLVVFNV